MKRYVLLILCLMMLPLLGYSQGTTSGSIQGVVVDTQGEPIPGANVVAIHQPTGSRYGAATRANGRYTLRNVRVGGPYVVQVTFVGFNAQKKEITNVELGETVELNFDLEEGEMTLGEISVIAQVDPVFDADRTGAKTNISQEEIDRTPTLTRSLDDFTRLTPQSTGGGSFGGANSRYNNILVDGATLNDVFGLGEGTPGSSAGVSSPISIDAIEEFNVDLAPFDVTNNNFTGGQVNAITKSGTNSFEGSVYYQYRDESFSGTYTRVNGDNANDLDTFEEQFINLSLGGPIIEDKLFFFVNAELKRESAPVGGGIIGSGEGNIFPGEQSLFNDISDVFQNTYGYNPGSIEPLSLDQDNDKVLAKIDWNINQNHKLTLRYNYVDAVDEQGISRSESSYDYSNRRYDFNSTQNSLVAELNSNFSNNMSNTFRAVYTRIRDSRDVVSQAFPQVELSYSLDGDFRSIYAGIDRFSQANALDQDLIEITDNFTYIAGDHEFTIGTSNQLYSFNNLYVQDAFGTYTFRGGPEGPAAQYLENGDPYRYQYSYLLPDGNPRAEFDGIQLGLYVQDQWTVSDRLTVTAGLRADMPILPDDPSYNPTAEEAFGYDTRDVASGNVLWSPRLGFNYDASSNGITTQIRGGIGIFSGPPPFVWISNQYSNTGMDYARIDVNDHEEGDEFINIGGEGFFSPDPNDQPQQGQNISATATSEVNFIAKDFKYPQALKVNLAIDQELPLGITGTLEGIYTKDINAVTFSNINLGQVGTSKYGRPIYGELDFDSYYGNTTGQPNRLYPDDFTNAILLENTNKGYNYSITGELQKQFATGLGLNFAYTYNRAESVNNGTSSRAISNWQYNQAADMNNPDLGTSYYERRHRILAQASYRLEYASRLATTISLIYDGYSGTPYSWVYNGDADGNVSGTDGFNDLVYVPETADEVVLSSDNWGALNGFINDHESLDEHRGEIVPRGTAREPWTNRLDLKVNQEIGTFNGQKLELTASIFNVLNLLSNDWGLDKYVSYNNYRIWNMQGYVDQAYIDSNPDLELTSEDIGEPIISFDPADGYDSEMFETSNITSRWRMQLSVRYSF